MKHSFFWDLGALFSIVNFAFAFVLYDSPPPSEVIPDKKYQRDLPSGFHRKVPEQQHTWARRDIGTFSNATANIIFNYTVFIDNTPAGFGFSREITAFKANTTGAIISLEIHYNKTTPVAYPGCLSFDDFHVYPNGTNRNDTNLLTNGGFDTGSYANATLVNGVPANATVINGTIAPWFNTYQNQTLNAKVGTKDDSNAPVGAGFDQLTNYSGTAFAFDCPRSALTDGIGQLIHTVPGQAYNLDFLLGLSAGPPRSRLMFFRVYATDVTGPLNLRLTTATDTGVSQTDGVTNLATPTLQGTWPGYSAGYQINIYINDTSFYGTATLGSDGTFTYPITQPLSNGTTNFTIRGNFSLYQDYELPMSSSFLVTYIQPPTLTLQLTNNPGNRNASSPTVVLNGVGVPNHPVSIYSNLQPGVVQVNVPADSNGAYTATLYLRPNGTRMYTAQQVGVGDIAGNPSIINSATIPVTVYTQPILSLSLSSNITNNGATPPTVILSGTGQAYLPVLIYEGSTSTLPLLIVTADSLGVYSATLPSQLNGTHSYIALQLGACCNSLGLFINITSNSVPATVYTPPVLTLRLTSNTTNNNATPPTVSLTGTGSPNLPVSLYEGSTGTSPIFNTTANGLGVYSATLFNVSNGTHVYIAQEANVCCNGAGSAVTVNSPAQTANVYIQPTITLRPANNQSNSSSSSNVQLTGTGVANSLVIIYENFSNSTSLANTTADNTGAYNVTLPNQAPGVHNYIAEQQNTCCTGGGSLINIDSLIVTITILPPSLTLTLPNNASSGTVNSSTVSLVGSGTSNLPVSVYDNTTGALISVYNTTADANGGYSATFFNQTSGTHTYVSEQSVGSTLVKSQPAIVTIPQVVLKLTLLDGSRAGTTNSSTVLLVGTGSSSLPVSVYDNSTGTLVSVYNTTTDANGVYTTTLLNQAPGTHTYVSQQSAGGTLVISQPVVVTIPQVVLTLTLPNGSSTGTTNSSTVSLVGTGSQNLAVSIYDNTTGILISVYNTTTDANGAYTATVPNQSPGTHNYVSQQSVGGTLIKSQPAVVTVPQVVLTLTLLNGSSTGAVNSSTVPLIGSGISNLAVSVYDNSTGTLISVYNTTADVNGGYIVTISNQSPGTHIYVSQQSVGGNIVYSQPAIVTVPQVALTLTLPDGTSKGTLNSSTVPLIGSGTANLAVSVFDNSTGTLISVYNTTANVNGGYIVTALNQSPGTHTYVSQQSVGGTLLYSLPVTVTIPQPIITLTLPDGTNVGTSNSSTALLIGTGTPNLPVSVYDNSTGTLISVYNTTAGSVGAYSATLSNQTAGTHTYVSEQQVGGSLVKSQPAIVIIPASPLTLTLPNGASAGVLNSTIVSLIGTGTPNLPVTIFDNSTGTLVVVSNTITDGNGNYNVTAYSQAFGNHAYVSQQQVGGVLVTSQLVIVTIPPSILTLTLPDGTQLATLNTTNVTLIGSGNPSLAVVIYDNTTGSPVIVSNVSTNSAGAYSVPLQNQTSGTHVYVSQQIVGSTVISSLPVTITIILPTTPTLTLTLGNDSINASTSTTVYLTGSGTPNLPVSIFDSATGSLVSVANTTTYGAGAYNATLFNQASGSHTYVAQQIVNGNVVNSPALVDTIIQPTLTLSLANGTFNYSTSTSVSLIGAGTASLPVFVYDNSTSTLISVANTTANVAGGYNVLLLNQTPGTHTYISQQNVSGIIVSSQPVVDTIIQPSLTLSLANGTSNYSSSTTVSLNGVGTTNLPVFIFDNSTGVPISVFNGTTDGTGQYNDTLFNQAPGTHTYVSQQQVAGITITSQPLTITIVQPTLTLSLANSTSNTSASTNVSLAGIGTSNLPVAIYDNSTGQLVPVANTTANGVGSYNTTLFNQTPGSHVYVSQQQVGANLISSLPLTVVILKQDTLNLTLIDGTDYGISYDPNITLIGKAPPNGMPVLIFDLDTVSIVGNAAVDSSGFFTVSLPNQTSGTHGYIAVENDGASGEIASGAVLVEILTANLTLTLANTPYTNTSANVSTSPSVPLTGSGVANQPVYIYSGTPGNNSTPIYNTTTDSLGNYNVVLPNQSNGTNIYTSEQVLNGAGKQTIVYSNPQIVVVSKPILTLTLPDGSLLGVSNSSEVYLIGVGTPNLLTYVYQNSTNGTLNLVGNATTDANGAYTVELLHQSDGSHTYVAEQTNAGGNSVIISQQCVVIVSAPTLTLTLPDGSTSGVLNSSTLVLESVGTPNLPVYILTNSTNGTITVATVPANNLGSYTITIPDQQSGTHVYTAEYRDNSGNPIADSGPVTVSISIPTITLTLPNGSTTGVSNSSIISLTGDGIPNLPVYILTNTTNGTATLTLTITDSVGAFNVTLFNQQAGTQVYTAEQRDNSGKPIADSSPVTVVITLPTLTLTLPNGLSSGISSTPNVTLTGKGTPGFPVIIYENSTTGNPVRTFYPASDGTYNVTLVNESSGNHTFIAEQRDNSGNLIADSQPCVVTVLFTQTLTLTLTDGSLSGTSNTTTVKLIGTGIANIPVEVYEATSFANASMTNGKLVANTTTDSAGVYNVTLVNQNPGTGYYVASQQIPSVEGGSTSLLSKVVTVTVPLPTLTLTLPNGAYTGTVNSSSVPLSGNGLAGYSISIYDNSTGTLISVANTTADSLGSYSATIPNQLNGTHIYVAEELVSDLDGNPITIMSQPNVIINVSLPPTPVTPILTLGLVGGGNVSNTVDVSLTGQGTPYLPVYIYQDSPFTIPLGKVYADATGAYNLTLYNQTEGTHNYVSAQQVPDSSGTPQIITSPITSVVVRPIRVSTYSPTLVLSTAPSSVTPSISYNATVFSPTASITASGASSGIPSNSTETSVPSISGPSISPSYSANASTIVTSGASVSYSANSSAVTTEAPSFSPSNSASNATVVNTASSTSLYNVSNSSEISTSTAIISPSSSENSGITTSSLGTSTSYSAPNSSVAETGTPSISASYSANSSAIVTENPSVTLSYSATNSSTIDTGTPSSSSFNSVNTSVVVTGSPSISPYFDTSGSSVLITNTPTSSPSYSAFYSSELSPTGTPSGSASYSASNLTSVIITSSPSISSSYSVPESSMATTSGPSSTLSNSANSSVIETSIPDVSSPYSATNSSAIMTTSSPNISSPSSAPSSSEIGITSPPSVSPSYSASNISELYTTSTIGSISSYSGASNNQGAGIGSTSNTVSNSTTIYSGTLSVSQSYGENTSVVITGSRSIFTSYSTSNYSEVTSTAYSSSGTPDVSSSYSVNSSSIFTSTLSASASYDVSSTSVEITTSTTSASLSYTANTSYPVTGTSTITLSNTVYNSSVEASTSVSSTSFSSVSSSSDISFATSITTSYSAANSSTIVITESPSVTSSYATNTSEILIIFTSSANSLNTSSLASSNSFYSTNGNAVSPTDATQSLSSITTAGTPSISPSYSASNISTESTTSAPGGTSSYNAISSVIITLETSTGSISSSSLSNSSMESTTATPGGTPSYTTNSSVITTSKTSIATSSSVPSNSLSNSSTTIIASISSASLSSTANSIPPTSSYYSTNGNWVSPTNATQSLSSITTTGTSGPSQSYGTVSDLSVIITESSSTSSSFTTNYSSTLTNSPNALPSSSASDSSIVATSTPSIFSTYITSNSSVITEISFSSETPSASANSSVISTTSSSSGIPSSSSFNSTAVSLMSDTSTFGTSYTTFVVITSAIYSSSSLSGAFTSSLITSTSTPSDSTTYAISNLSTPSSTESISILTSGTTTYLSSSSLILTATSSLFSPSSSIENTSYKTSNSSIYSPTSSTPFSTIFNNSAVSTAYSVISSEIPSSSVSISSTTVISTTEIISSTVSSLYITSNSSQTLSTSVGPTTPTVLITETFISSSSAIISTTVLSTPTQSATASETILSSISNSSQLLSTSTGSTTSPVTITDIFSSTGTSSATTAVSTVSPSITTVSTIYSTNSSVTSVYSSETSTSSPNTIVYLSTNLLSSSGTTETTYGSATSISTISLSSSTELTLVPTSNTNLNPTSRYSTATSGQSSTGTGTGSIIISTTNSSQAVTTSTESVSLSYSYLTTSTYSVTSSSGTVTYSTTTSVYVISNSTSTGSPSETIVISTSSPAIFLSSSSTESSNSSGLSGNSSTTSSSLTSATTIFNTITASLATSSPKSTIPTETGGTVTTTTTSTYGSQPATSTSAIVPSNSKDTSSLEITSYSPTETLSSFALSTLTVSRSPTSNSSTIPSLTSISSYVETSSTFSTSNAYTTTVYQSSSDSLIISTSSSSTSMAMASSVYQTTSSLISSSASSLNGPTNTSSTSLSASPTTSTYISITSSTGLYSSSSSATISGSGSSSLYESATSGNTLTSTTYSESVSTSNTVNATATGESTSSLSSTESTTRLGSTSIITNTGDVTSSLSSTVSTTRPSPTNSATSSDESTSSSSGTASTSRPGSTNSGRNGPTNTSPTTISSTSMVAENITSPISSSSLISNTTTIPGTGSIPTLNSYISVSESSLTATVPVSESTISSSTSESLSISSTTLTRSVSSRPPKQSSHIQTHRPTETKSATTNTAPSSYTSLSTSSSNTFGNSQFYSSPSTTIVPVSGSGTVSSSTGSGSLTTILSSSNSPTTISSTEVTSASSGSSVTTTTGSSTETLISVLNTTSSVAHSSTVTGTNSITYTETVSTLSSSFKVSSGQIFASATSSTSSITTVLTSSTTSCVEGTTSVSVSYDSTLTSATNSYISCLVYSTTSYISDYGYVTSTYIAYTTTCLISPTGSELTSPIIIPSASSTTSTSGSMAITETASVSTKTEMKSATTAPGESSTIFISGSTEITEAASFPTITKVNSATTTPGTSLTTSTIYSTTTYTSGNMIVTDTVVDYTTVCSLTSSEERSVSGTRTTEGEYAFPTPSTLSAISDTQSPKTIASYGLTTSTIYTTTVYTITSCAQTITNCPDHIGSVTTEVISLNTTICPVTEEVSTSTTEPTEPYATTLTVYATTMGTITSCAPEVTDCPAKIGSLTTTSYAVYTSITTVTPILPGSTPELYLSTQASPPDPTETTYAKGPAPTVPTESYNTPTAPTVSPYTIEPTLSAEPSNTLPAPSMTQYVEPTSSALPSYNETWSSNFTTSLKSIIEYIRLSSISEAAPTSAASEITSQTESSKPAATSPPVSKYTAGAAQNVGRVSVAILVCIIAFFL